MLKNAINLTYGSHQAALEEGNFSCPTSGITMSKQLAQSPSA